MTRMSLTTFLFHDCLDSVARTRKLAQYAEPGGRDYFWAAKRAAGQIFLDDKSFDQAVGDVMMNMSKAHQRQDNHDALKGMYNWKLANPGKAHQPPVGELAGPQNELIVTLRPTFALEKKGVITTYVPWMYKDERLTSAVAGMGIHLMELILQQNAYSDWRFAMIDTVAGKIFTKTHKHTAEAVMASLKTQEEIIIAHKAKKAA